MPPQILIFRVFVKQIYYLGSGDHRVIIGAEALGTG